MSDFYDFEDLDFKNSSTLIRGETPKDIEKRVHKICCEYLGGAWLKITAEEMIFRRISSGLTNQLYYCGLPENVKVENDEPREVAVRFHGAKHFYNFDDDFNERLTDTVIGILMSEAKICPKKYGIFKGGEVEEYIQCHPFFEKEENDPEMVNELAKKLAQIHYLNPPIKKKIYCFEQMERSYENTYNNSEFPIEKYINDLNLEHLKNNDIMKEINYLKKCISGLNSPVVLTHNDFRNTNILVRNNEKDNEKLLIGDYEYANYGYRGYDFSFLFSCWGHTKVQVPAPLPSDETLKQFFKFYIDECVKLRGNDFLNDELNSIEHMILETKILNFSSIVFFVLLSMKLEENLISKDQTTEKMMQLANSMFGVYFQKKRKNNHR